MCLLRHLKMQCRKLALTVLERGQMWESFAWFLLSLHVARYYRHAFWISLAPETSYECKYSFAALDDNSYAPFILKYVVSRPVSAGGITVSRVQGYFLSLLFFYYLLTFQMSVKLYIIAHGTIWYCFWCWFSILEFEANLLSLSSIPDAIACILFQHNSFWYHPFCDSL